MTKLFEPFPTMCNYGVFEGYDPCGKPAAWVGTIDVHSNLQRFLCDEHKDKDMIQQPLSEFYDEVERMIVMEALADAES